jgi:hypothetical protein
MDERIGGPRIVEHHGFEAAGNGLSDRAPNHEHHDGAHVGRDANQIN